MSVFISHSMKDQAVYTSLCAALDKSGVRRWDVSTLTSGGSLSDQLQSAIMQCDVCIFLATSRSVQSPWCQAELGAFWGSGKIVILFMADPDLNENELPRQFKDQLRETSFQGLINAIKKREPALVQEDDTCRVIPTRRELYDESEKLIKSSARVRDTTLGARARDLSKSEKKARKRYRDSVRSARQGGLEYFEIITIEGREKDLESLKQTAKDNPNYTLKSLPVDASKISMVDFFIGDDKQVIFAHVSTQSPGHNTQYVTTTEPSIVKLFTQAFTDMWLASHKLI